MAFALSSLDQPIRDDLHSSLRRDWDRLAGPGATWTGAQRISLASHARAARAGDEPGDDPIPSSAGDVARAVGARPATIRAADVQRWLDDGLGAANYVELVGVVSRVAATDSIMRALGQPPEPFPAPVAGEPTGRIAADARQRRGWVPMVGATSIVGALSLVPGEMAAMIDYHGPAYLTMEEMADPTYTRGLDRAQMELVAARTSAINECFY